MTGEHPPATSAGLPTSAPAAAKFGMPSPRWAIAATFFAFGVASGSWSGSSAAILARAGVGAWAFGVALTCFTGAYLAAMSSGGVGRPAVHGQTHADRGVADDRPRSRRSAAGLDGDRDLRPADRLWSARRHARRDDERGRRADRAAPGHADFRAAARRQPPPVERSARSSAACWRPAPRPGRRE